MDKDDIDTVINTIDVSTINIGEFRYDTVNNAGAGDVWYDTVNNNLNVYNGTTYEWTTINDGINITLNEPVEFEDHMPSVAKVEDMCKEYPGLKKAYENFKSIYKMVHQDWQGRQDDSNKPTLF